MWFWIHCQEIFDVIAMGKDNKQSNTVGYVMGLLGPIDWGGDKDKEAAKLEQQEARRQEQFAIENPELFKKVLGSRPPPGTSSQSSAGNGIRMADVVERHLTNQRARVDRSDEDYTNQSFNDAKPRILFWKEYFGDRLANSITKAEILEISDWLMHLPDMRTKGMNPGTAIEAAKASVKPTSVISPQTYNHYSRELRSIISLAYQLDAIDQDWSNMVKTRNAKKAGAKKNVLPFTDDDMQALFPGADYGVDFGRKGPTLSWEAKFWLPLAGAFTGARIEELAQLTTRDVIRDDKTQILYLNIVAHGKAADGQKKRTKNNNSIRPVPIHPTLLEIGFEEYWLERCPEAGGSSSLFKMTRGGGGKYGSSASKWFTSKQGTGYIERRGVESSGIDDGQQWGKSFHSFRHTVVTNLRDANKRLPDGARITGEDRTLIVGHGEGDERGESKTTKGYGLAVANLELRRDIIEQIHYPSVDFESISWEQFRANNQL